MGRKVKDPNSKYLQKKREEQNKPIEKVFKVPDGKFYGVKRVENSLCQMITLTFLDNKIVESFFSPPDIYKVLMGKIIIELEDGH